MTKTTTTSAPEAAQATPAAETINHTTEAPGIALAEVKKLNIHERLLCVEQEIDRVEKTGQNKDQGDWKFMEHSAIVAIVRPLLGKYRVKYYNDEEENTITPQEGWNKDAKQVVPRGSKSAKKVKHIFVNVDKPEEKVEGYTFTEANSMSDKASNAASTYAQKLWYLRTFNLTDADPDAETLEASPIKPTAKISKSRETDIYTMLKKLNLTVEDYEAGLTSQYGNGKEIGVSDLTNAQAQEQIDKMVAYITRQTVTKQG